MMTVLLQLVAVECVVLLSDAAIAPALPASAYPSEITVTTVADGTIAGELIRFSLADGLTYQPDHAEASVKVQSRDLVQIVTAQHATVPPADAMRFELTGGDLLFGNIHGFKDGILLIDARHMGDMEVLTDRLASLKTPASSRREYAEAIALRDDRAFLREDMVLLTNRDVVQGFITAIEPETLSIETTGGITPIPMESVVAAWLVSPRMSPIEGIYTTITTRDGQQLTASHVAWEGSQVDVTLPDGARYRIPAEQVARINLVGGRWRWLATLDPISYEHTPALSVPWDFQVDRSVIEGPLQTAGQTFTRGIGVHSESSITFDLEGNYREFTTQMGLDDSAGRFAEVDVEIRVDGQLKYEQKGVAPGRLHGPIRFDVAGAKRIQLIVLFGKNADIQDRFNWIEPALIK